MPDAPTPVPPRDEGEHVHETTSADLTDRVVAVLDHTEPALYHKVLRSAAMRRRWRPKHSGWQNVSDQILHVIYAGAIFLPVLAWPSYATAAASGFLMGVLRELGQFRGQDLRILMFWDRVLDVSTFTLGALLVFHFTR